MKIRAYLRIIYFGICNLCFTQNSEAQQIHFANNSLQVIYAGCINEISFVKTDSSFPYSIKASSGELERRGNKFYFFTFKSGDVCFKLLNLITDSVVDSINVKVVDVEDYEFHVYPQIGHMWSIEQFRLDSVSVSSKSLDLFANTSYRVSQFHLDLIRNGETIKSFNVNNYIVNQGINDSLKKIVKCNDKLVFDSFEINNAGHKTKAKGSVLVILFCEGYK